MKVTYNWLKEYVDFDWSVEELAERITMLGVEVEGIEETGGAFEGIVVGQVVTRNQHPNADKLSLCKVSDGSPTVDVQCADCADPFYSTVDTSDACYDASGVTGVEWESASSVRMFLLIRSMSASSSISGG